MTILVSKIGGYASILTLYMHHFCRDLGLVEIDPIRIRPNTQCRTEPDSKTPDFSGEEKAVYAEIQEKFFKGMKGEFNQICLDFVDPNHIRVKYFEGIEVLRL